MNPKDWRNEQKLTLAAIAERVGVRGKNPGATYRRWEDGVCRCPDAIVLAVAELSDGRVTADDWLRVRVDMKSNDAPPSSSQRDAA